MGKTLYLECYSGISGDMTVAALLDLGADQKHLEEALSSLLVQGFRIEISRVIKSGLNACDFSVILDQDNTIMIWNIFMDKRTWRNLMNIRAMDICISMTMSIEE